MPKRDPAPEQQITTVSDNRGGPRKRPTYASDQKGDRSIITVRVPLSTQQRGTRKLIITPIGARAWLPQRARIDDALIKAIARAHRWNRMLERGEYTSMTELANAEDVTESYLARILRLMTLSPKLIEAALDGSPGLPQLQQLVSPIPVEWREQEALFLRLRSSED